MTVDPRALQDLAAEIAAALPRRPSATLRTRVASLQALARGALAATQSPVPVGSGSRNERPSADERLARRRDVRERFDSPDDLLRNLLSAFDLGRAAKAADNRRKPASKGSYRDQLQRAKPTLIRVVAVLDELRGDPQRPLLAPQAYEARWQSIIGIWNEAVASNGWTELPRLCPRCGLPQVLRRADAKQCEGCKLTGTVAKRSQRARP